MVSHIHLRLRTAEFIQVLFTFLPHVHEPSGQPKTAYVPPNTGLFKEIRYYSVRFGIGFKKNNQFFPIVFQKIIDCSDSCPFK